MYLHRRTSTLIRKVSLEALHALVKGGILADIVLVDGDHNYHTVSRELLLIERLLRDDGTVFLHDVCWPNGRRDLYYDPERIPEDWRQQYARKEVIKGHSGMVDKGGLNPELAKAMHEGALTMECSQRQRTSLRLTMAGRWMSSRTSSVWGF